MEQQEPQTQNYIAAKYGLYIGIGLVVFDLIIWVLNSKGTSFFQNLNLFILIIGIVYCSQLYRDKELGGFITYGKALKFGTLLSFFASMYRHSLRIFYLNISIRI